MVGKTHTSYDHIMIVPEGQPIKVALYPPLPNGCVVPEGYHQLSYRDVIQEGDMGYGSTNDSEGGDGVTIGWHEFKYNHGDKVGKYGYTIAIRKN